MQRKPRVLLVEDQEYWLDTYGEYLKSEDYTLDTAQSTGEAEMKLRQATYDAVVTDLKLLGFYDDFSGFRVLEKTKELSPDTQVVIITGHGSSGIALRATKQGAFDYVTKPPDPDRLKLSVRAAIRASRIHAAKRKAIRGTVASVKRPTSDESRSAATRPHTGRHAIIGNCERMQQVFEQIEKAINTSLPVLIWGEAGTGKEQIARAIHTNSQRRGRPFSRVACADLYNYREAIGRNLPRLRGGTVFLDDLRQLGDMGQASLEDLLPAFESNDIQILASVITEAENHPDIAEKERIQASLIQALAQAPIFAPPLRERREDIPALVGHFINLFTEDIEPPPTITVSAQAMNLLGEHDYPANVRELRDIIQDAVQSLGGNRTLLPEHLPSLQKGARALSNLANTYAYLIGVGDYIHPRFASLPATVSDAQALAALLRDPARCGYPADNVQLLTSEQATAANIRAALESLAQSTDSQSTIFLYFSGHGGRILRGDQWRAYICPREANPDDLDHTAISGDELSALLAALPARKVVTMLDACHAAGSTALKAVDGTVVWKTGLPDDYYEDLCQGSGRIVIASSKEDQNSYVRPQGDLSLFTHHLLQALSGRAAVRGDGLIHILDVFHYVNEAVQADNSEQTPILKVKDLDLNFAIALDQGKKEAVPSPIPDVVAIRERIVRDPLGGAKALSDYLTTRSEWGAKRVEVDLKRAELEQVQQNLALFGPNPGDQTTKNRTIYFLLHVCLELEQPTE